MINSAGITEKFDELKVCVIIPAYNNASTLGEVISSVSAYTKNIIVINDGSTEHTNEVVQAFPFVQYISYAKNAGKGFALRTAFKYADEHGYRFAITIDADGQHFASDLPAFINKLLETPGAIIVGARNMNQASVPGKSSFGHKFSNFWFNVETGITCPDTQSGYRLYPLSLLNNINFITRKYEFEIEVLVRAAWKGVKIAWVPVTVYYAPKETRISHFRPFKDFTRISILNTVLVIIAFLYIKPRNFMRMLFNKKKMNAFFKEHLMQSHHSDIIKAASVAFGIFMGIIPIWGIQLGTAVFLAILLKLNKPLVIIAANISIPPMIPIIIFASYKTGAIWMGENAGNLEFNSSITRESVKNNIVQYIYGSITLAVLAAIVSGIITLSLLRLFKRKSILAG